MPSEAFSGFMSSIELDYDSWHDGEGFDLEALANIDNSERGDVVWELAQREATWREIEARMAPRAPCSWQRSTRPTC